MKDKFLQIAIKAIPETGLERTLDLGPEWFSRWREEDPGLEFATARIKGTVRLEKHGRDILVRGTLQGHLQLACSRCLESYEAPVEADFDLLLAPAPGRVSAEAEELSAADLDVDYYSGEVLDLEPIIREQIILLVPLKPLCREDCRGICPRCGAVLNLEACTCK
ncbi:MAG: YceD family protein [Thermodesulfobacteriota bacterium]